ncbi:MAG: transketolase C-terminal domain-containing protein [Nocardioidaceae bacterium]
MTTTLRTDRQAVARPPGSGPMREQFAATTTDLLDQDLSVALVLADISAAMFPDAVTRHPERVINVGIREQLAVNVGAGLALSGMRPIVHTIASFLVERSFEQIKLGFSHQDVGGVLVSVGASYDISQGGRTHQSPGDVALIDTLPDWDIHVPGHPAELDTLLREAVGGSGRVYIRASVRSNRQAYPTGGFHVVRRGGQGTVIAVGPMLDNVLAAVGDLDLTVLYAATVRPFDADTLARTLGTADVVLVEPYAVGTSAAAVSEALSHVPHRLKSIGVPRAELRRYGTPSQHETEHGLDPAGLRRTIGDFLTA